MLRITDDTTDSSGVTTFYFSDGTTLKAVQAHHVSRAPFIPKDEVTAQQRDLVKSWSNCELLAK
jgi:hypothetical protein